MILDRILGGAAVAFLLAAGVQTWRLDRAQAAHERDRLEWAQERLQAADAARAMVDSYRAKEAQWQAAKAAAEVESEKRTKALESRLAAAVADRERLRDAYRTFARGPADPADDSVTAARDRAEALGVLLGQADGRAERDARELEALNEEKRLLLEAWPR